MTIENTIIDQVVYPYFMITSIKKDLTKVDIECVQLHSLDPSIYDEWDSPEIVEDEVPEEDQMVVDGDVNQDGNVDVLDVITAVNLILNAEYDSTADLNQDGLLNVMDVVILFNQILDE